MVNMRTTISFMMHWGMELIVGHIHRSKFRCNPQLFTFKPNLFIYFHLVDYDFSSSLLTIHHHKIKQLSHYTSSNRWSLSSLNVFKDDAKQYMFTNTNKYIEESGFLIFFYNKTEYFRLRLSYKVSSELRETWDRPEPKLQRLRSQDKLEPDGRTNGESDSLSFWQSQKRD